MSAWSIALLGAFAGLTIFLGLPFGRIRNPSLGLRVMLNGLAIGILLFLLWDVLAHAVEPVEQALIEATDGQSGSWGRLVELAVTVIIGVTCGLMSLVYYSRWMAGRSRAFGPGAAAAAELGAARPHIAMDAGRRLALVIAVGIGLHNFSEGLAIGQSAASGELSLAVLLIIGFGLHNATEGFGIVGPMSGEAERPSWGFLGLMGLIGGGPTFLGTLIGQAWVSPALEVAFFAVAAGSILYVVIQLFEVCRRYAMPTVVAWSLLLGLL